MNGPLEKTSYRLLLESGQVPKKVLDRIYQEAEVSEANFSQLLVRSGLITEQQMLAIYSEKLGFPILHLKNMHFDESLFKKVPVKFAAYYKFFPVKLDNRRLTIASARPLDVSVIDEIRFGLGYEVEVGLAPEKEIEEMLNRFYGLGADTLHRILSHSPEDSKRDSSLGTHDVEDLEKLAETPSVIQLVNQIILEAYRKRATDIHLEPFRGKIRLRYRIDGQLHEQTVPPEMRKFFVSILSRIKIMANLNIVERRLPQDGKARVKTQDETLDLRISCVPTPHGESMVIRILPSQMILALGQLGFEGENQKIFEGLVKKPYGIVFLTGPTGSGKTTTLYAALNTLNCEERKIVTIEDPIEYELEGITQLQIAPDIGLTFAQGLKNLLRHDPDVMMVGEVRDLETADIAIRAALTGHLILSTLHTNDAASGITRLIDIGVEPYLVASSVNAFIAQRLVRVICPHCREEVAEVPDHVRLKIERDLGMGPQERIRIFRGKGCAECNGTGFLGRTAIHEILVLDDKLRQLIMERSSSAAIKKEACQKGMKTLRQDGWLKVLKGLTTPEEVLQITPEDEIPLLSIAGTKMSEAPTKTIDRKQSVRSVSLPKSGEGWLLTSIENINEQALKREHSEHEMGKREVFPKMAGNVERRSYPRLKIEVSVKFRVVDPHTVAKGGIRTEEWEHLGKTQDVSARGVAFITREPVQVGLILEIRIDLPDGQKPIQCIGRVVRVTRMVDPSPPEPQFVFKVAISYLAIPSDDRMRLEHFCKTHHLES